MRTHHLYQRGYEREHKKVAIDNATVVLGRSDRKLLNEAERFNRWLHGAEKIHHKFHVCARVPEPSGICISQDLMWESLIRVKVAVFEAFVELQWQQGRAAAVRELNSRGYEACHWRRPLRLPVHKRICFCGLPREFRVKRPFPISKLSLCSSHFRPKNTLKLKLENGQWQYHIELSK